MKQYFGEKALRSLIRLVKSGLGTKVDTSAVVNDLTSVDATKVLSAAQGKVLNDAMATQKTELENKIAEISGAEGLDKKLDADKVGVAGGVAPLDEAGQVSSEYLPSYVDDVIEGYYDAEANKFYEDEAKATAIDAEKGKIYIDLPTNVSYRWGGTTFVAITSSDLVEIEETSVEALWEEIMGGTTTPEPEVPTEYNVTVAAAENGTVTVSAEKAAEGTEVTITAEPAEGYEVGTVTVSAEKAAEGTEVTVTDNKFTMPAGDVTVTVTFTEVAAE